MIIRFRTDTYQDTVGIRTVPGRDTLLSANDTIRLPDYLNSLIEPASVNLFPYRFLENSCTFHTEKQASAEKYLRHGENIPQKVFHEDWIIVIILLAIILFSLVKASTKSFLPGISRFFLFRGTKDEYLRDISGLFQWQSTVLNLSSFLVIGLYAYFAASYFRITPFNAPGIIVWLIALLTIISALTLRHIVCVVTGLLSGQVEIFQDYLHTVYQSYRYVALLLFIIVMLISYTSFLNEKSYFTIGAILLVIFYFIRIFRLFIIFINRNISIFYLILYLCALEILPIMVSVKYFSGLV